MSSVTKDYIVEQLKEIIEDDEVTTKDRLAALRLAGDSIGMFTKRVEYDIRTLIANLSTKELKGLRDGRSPEVPTIEAEVLPNTVDVGGECGDQRVQPGESVGEVRQAGRANGSRRARRARSRDTGE